jgi:hypothetical protein
MDFAALEVEFRKQADDATEPYLYSEADLLRWATAAEREACLRAKLLYDETSDFLSIAVTAGVSSYALDARIDRIERVSFTPSGGTAYDLAQKGVDFIHDQYDWQRQTGRPKVAAWLDRRLIIWPTPTMAGALQMGAYRFPLSAFETETDEPEIPEEHHMALVDWMLFLAYTNKDGETEDSPRAALRNQLFTQHFGERPSADVLRRHREKRRVTTRYGGY